MEKLYTAHMIYKENRIYWVKSYKAILKYMRKYRHILKPLQLGEGGPETRYFVTERNLRRFVKMFENNKLS